MTKTDRLFVYGTLMKGFRNPVARYLHATQEFLGEASFSGFLFKISFYPGAVFVPEAESNVFGHLFKIVQNRESLFQKLDDYEGIGTNYSQPNEFRREIINVSFDGNIVTAYSYLFNSTYEKYPLISSGKFNEDFL